MGTSPILTFSPAWTPGLRKSYGIVNGQSRQHLEPKVVAVLCYLLTHPGEIVSQEELLEHVWTGRLVEPGAVSRNIGLIRQALKDNPRRSRYIETIPKRGYRTVAPVTAGSAAEPTLATEAQSLAVLPFANLSGGVDGQRLGDSVAEEIINRLSRLPDTTVIARTSSFQFRNTDIDVRAIGESLGVSHLIEGSVRRSGKRIRISAKLIEARTRTQIWVATCECGSEDAFAIQDQVASEVLRRLKARYRTRRGPRGQGYQPPASKRSRNTFF